MSQRDLEFSHQRQNQQNRRSRSSSPGSRNDERKALRDFRERDREREHTSLNHALSQVPTSTIIIRGLAPKSTESSLYTAISAFAPQSMKLFQKDNGECKGYAFVDFYSSESASYFMSAFAGSAGNLTAPQLIVDNRAVTIEYSRDNFRNDEKGKESNRIPSSIKSDWLCESCGFQNFAKRIVCFRCSVAKSCNAVKITATLSTDPFCDAAIVSPTPSPMVVIRGLPPFATEDQVNELLRQFALVKYVQIIRDVTTGLSRGIAVAEFQSTEHATHTINSAVNLSLDRNQIKLNFAKDTFLKTLSIQNHHNHVASQFHYGSIATNAYAMAALQAAKWAATATVNSPDNQVNICNSSETVKNSPRDFETHGASYDYQSLTGCFYDSNKKIYYCPKSKLYYDEVFGMYWVFSEGRFVEYHPILPTTIEESIISENCGLDSTEVLNDCNRITAKKRKTPLIGITIKKNAYSTQNDPVIPPSIIASANFSSIIEKWNERKVEMQNAHSDELPSTSVAAFTTANSLSSLLVQESHVALFVCYICRRKFQSEVMLHRHENESKLHKENVNKQSSEKKCKDAPCQYRDRALERRALHGPSNEIEELSYWHKRGRSRSRSIGRGNHLHVQLPPDCVESTASSVSVSNDATNPGGQLLRLMGWKDGEGLGRDGLGKLTTAAEESAKFSKKGRSGIGS